MKNRSVYIVIVLLVVLVGGYFALVYNSGNQFRWSESYGTNDEEPYGGKVFSTLMQNHMGEDRFHFLSDSIYNIYDSLGIEEPANYMYYGRELYLDSMDLDFLLKFVERGNTAYVISKRFSWPLFDTLFYQPPHQYYWGIDDDEYSDWSVWDYLEDVQDTSMTNYLVTNNAVNHELKWIRYNEVSPHDWYYFQDDEIAEGEFADELGGFKSGYDYYSNFIAVPFGEGKFYLHCTPEAFTNYHLLEREGFDYAREVMAHLNDGDIIWDEHNRTPTYRDPVSTPPNTSDGPLSFIQGEPALRAALYTILLLVLLYVLFGLRRKQKAIPVLVPRENTSIEFSEVISQLYLSRRDHRKLGLLKMRLFQSFILERYGIRSKGREPEQMQEYGERIALKSNLPKTDLKELMDTFRQLTVVYNVDNPLLIQFHQQLEYFYRNCK